MNKKSKILGLNNTSFQNSTGWPHKDHYMSSLDLAILAKELYVRFPQYMYYFAEKKHLTPPLKVENNIFNSIPNDFDKFRTSYLYHNYGNIFASLSHYLGTSGIKKTDIVLVAGMDRSKAASVRYNFNNLLFDVMLFFFRSQSDIKIKKIKSFFIFCNMIFFFIIFMKKY